MTELEATLARATPEVRRVLDASLAGRDLTVDDAVRLCGAAGADLPALVAVADELRRAQAGDRVGYVINRNVNFTNVCVKTCKFCAFSRLQRSEQAYFLDAEEIVRRTVEAHELGATEVCIQAGLAPSLDGRFYVELVRAIKRALPALHVHAFSPEEIKYGAHRAGVPIGDYLAELRDAGLGSLPGTSAEILDDAVRARIAPGRITTAEWIEVITTAHRLGIPTTSTIMYGHVESDLERMRHLALLRSVQRETRGFTEFVPLSFVHHEAPMNVSRDLPDLRPGPTADDVVRLYAISRLMLGESFRNIQASWVKEGMARAQRLLSCGANDLGGTLINESISTSAGAGHGQFQPPGALRRSIREAGRVPYQRDTLYRTVREHAAVAAANEEDPLDRVANAAERFGSYVQLTRDARFRFKRPRAETPS